MQGLVKYLVLSEHMYNKHFSIVQTALLVLIVFPLPGCSGETDNDTLYKDYVQLCSIIDVEYTEYQKSDKTFNDKVSLYGAIEQKVNGGISSAQVKETYFMLVKMGSEDAYDLLRHDVESRTGREYTCESFKKLTAI